MTARRYVLALDQGTTGSTTPGRRSRRSRASRAATPSSRSTIPARLGRARPRGDLVDRRAVGSRGARRGSGDRRARSPRSASRTSARPRSCGTARRAPRSIARSSGSAAAPLRSATGSAPTGWRAPYGGRRGSSSTPTSRARRFAGCSTRSPTRARRAERGELAFGTGRLVARLEAHRRPGPRDRRDERLADAAASTSGPETGARRC